jgi:Ser/Thr protein kinase RdoA (MazF antagonist)
MRLQREVDGRQDELVVAGLTRIATSDAAEYVAARVEALASLPDADPRRMTREQVSHVRKLDPAIRDWMAQVQALGLQDTLVHNDLHGHNVFAVSGRMRFFDFGDAVLANPLWALLIPLRVMASRLDARTDDPRLRRVADAAIEVWGDLRPVSELRAALPAALQLARLGRVESWLRVLATMTPTELADLGDAASWWLGSLAEEPPLL